jgi:hypothetical protein
MEKEKKEMMFFVKFLFILFIIAFVIVGSISTTLSPYRRGLNFFDAFFATIPYNFKPAVILTVILALIIGKIKNKKS